MNSRYRFFDMVHAFFLLTCLGDVVLGGTLLWDGRIYNRTVAIDNLRPCKCQNCLSFHRRRKLTFSIGGISKESTHHGPYQYYIHGNKDLTRYVGFSPSFKHPGDTFASDGIKITIDASSTWHGQPMLRTELVQEKSPGAAGKCFMSPNLKPETQRGTLFYHFSMKKMGTNSPKYDAEHQINFLLGFFDLRSF
jgi:Glycoside hydrolase 131 catalytic N-terminal domain